MKKVSLKRNFILDDKLSNISYNFKFYRVCLNSRYYILGIHYLGIKSVRKIRLSESGLLLEDITDTVLADGSIKRVNKNNVVIIKNNRIIGYNKLIRFSPINKIVKKDLFTENPIIGVLDFETYE